MRRAPQPLGPTPQGRTSLLSACGTPLSCQVGPTDPPPTPAGSSPKAQSCPGPPRSETLQPIPDSQQVPILQWVAGACRSSPSPAVCTLSTRAHWTHPSPGAHPRPPLFCSSLRGRSLSFTLRPWPPPMCAPTLGSHTRRASPVGLTPTPRGHRALPAAPTPGSAQQHWGCGKGCWRGVIPSPTWRRTGTSVSRTHLHLLVNPVQEGGDARVDSGLVHVGTADAKARGSHQLPHPPLLAHQRPPTVSLDGKDRGTEVGGVLVLEPGSPPPCITKLSVGMLTPPASKN